MMAPIPETRTTIVLLNGSRVRPNGTWKTPLIPIHVNSAAAVVCCAKIKQLQAKLTTTAPVEIELLNAFHRSVNNVITAALSSGVKRIIHGKIEVIRLAARESRELTRMVQRQASGEMTNAECRMTNAEGMTKSECQKNVQVPRPFEHSGFFRHSSFVLPHCNHSRGFA
jgi:hypothetical protein